MVKKLILEKLKLINFRNYRKLSLKFSPKINIIVGNNGVGKTNILEAIYILALSKSFKLGSDFDVVNFNQKKTIIKGEIKENKIPKTLSCEIEENSKKIALNNNHVKKTSNYIGNLKVVLFTPDDINIIKGSPSERRKYLNIALSQNDREYLVANNEYNKLLKIRNDYLRKMQYNSLTDKKYLDVITANLIKRAVIIYKKRNNFIREINNYLKDIYLKIAKHDNLFLSYIPNIDINNFFEEDVKEKLIKQFKENFSKELKLGLTLYGPHRDDLSFILENKNLKLYGSEGEQKLAIISLKLSEIENLKEKNISPILLLDDLFSDLDNIRKQKLIEFINKDGQVIITGNDLRSISKKIIKDAKIFKIKNNEILEK